MIGDSYQWSDLKDHYFRLMRIVPPAKTETAMNYAVRLFAFLQAGG